MRLDFLEKSQGGFLCNDNTHSCSYCGTALTSVFSGWMYHSHMNQSQRSTLPLLNVSWQEFCSGLWGSFSLPAGSLITSTAPTLDRKRKKKRRFEKGTKREKLLIYIPLNPWPPDEPGISGSSEDTPISPSAPPIRNNAGACHKPSWLMRGSEREGEETESVCGGAA